MTLLTTCKRVWGGRLRTTRPVRILSQRPELKNQMSDGSENLRDGPKVPFRLRTL